MSSNTGKGTPSAETQPISFIADDLATDPSKSQPIRHEKRKLGDPLVRFSVFFCCRWDWEVPRDKVPYRPLTSQSAIVSALEPPLPAPRTPQIHRILTVLTRLGLLSHFPHPVFEMTRLQSALFRRNVHKRTEYSVYYSYMKVFHIWFLLGSWLHCSKWVTARGWH